MAKLTTIDQIQYLFTFPFKDEDWKQKFLIAFLLTAASFFIPIIPWVFMAGYTAKIIEMGIKEDTYSLPDWDDWGNYFMNGLRLTALGFIAILPFFLLIGLSYFFMLSPVFLEVISSPYYGEDTLPLWTFTPLLGMAGAMFTMGLGIFLSLLVGVFLPAAMSHMIAEDQFSAAFRVKEWWAIFKANIWGYIIAFILLLGTIYMMMFAFQLLYMTVVLCCFIPFILSAVSVYISMFTGAVFGQTYRVGREKSGLDTEKEKEEEKE